MVFIPVQRSYKFEVNVMKTLSSMQYGQKYGIVRATKLYPIQQALESIIILLKLVFLQLKFI